MKKKRVIVRVALSAAFILLSLIAYRAVPAKILIRGNFQPEDVSQIESLVKRERWITVNTLAGAGKFGFLFKRSVPELMMGNVHEIGPVYDGPGIFGDGRAFTNIILSNTNHAYALSGGWYSQKMTKYDLKRTATGWKVESVEFR